MLFTYLDMNKILYVIEDLQYNNTNQNDNSGLYVTTVI